MARSHGRWVLRRGLPTARCRLDLVRKRIVRPRPSYDSPPEPVDRRLFVAGVLDKSIALRLSITPALRVLGVNPHSPDLMRGAVKKVLLVHLLGERGENPVFGLA